jgi:hypothetical protein
MSISSDDDTNSTEKLDGEYDSQNNFDVDIHVQHCVDAPYSVN